MVSAITERLISSDDHVDLSHESVKQNLAPKFHGDYDDAVTAFRKSVMAMASSTANQRWREQQGLAPDPTVSMSSNRKHAASERAGHTDANERLKDMDLDGVSASATYCEVSAFRYLYMVKNGWKESTRAFNDTLAGFASADPKRLVVSYQIPIHDIDAAVDEVRRGAAQGCKSLQLPSSPPSSGSPTTGTNATTPCGR